MPVNLKKEMNALIEILYSFNPDGKMEVENGVNFHNHALGENRAHRSWGVR